MGRRGRPPHPDILTPREWEVLALLREGLTNEAIAARLGVTHAAAKFHVSQILSRLGVSTREEAAAWEPGAAARRPWWAAALAWLRPVTLGKAALIGAAVVVVVGMGVLAWGVLQDSRDDPVSVVAASPTSTVTATPRSLPLIPTLSAGLLTADQVLVHAGRAAVPPVEKADIRLTTYKGALDAISDLGYSSVVRHETGKVPDDSPTWLVVLSLRTRFVRSSSDAPSPVTSAPDACRVSIGVYPDALSVPKPRFILEVDGAYACPVGAIQPSDRATIAAAWLGYRLSVLGETSVSAIAAHQKPVDEAVEAIRSSGGEIVLPPDGPYASIDALEREHTGEVWLVKLRGMIYDFDPTPSPSASISVPPCEEYSVIVAADGIPLASALATSSDCP